MSAPAESSGVPGQLLGRLAGKVPGRVVETVQPDVILQHVDADALVDRIDLNRSSRPWISTRCCGTLLSKGWCSDPEYPTSLPRAPAGWPARRSTWPAGNSPGWTRSPVTVRGAVSRAGPGPLSDFLIRANATSDSAELPRTTRGELFNSSPTATDRRDSEGMQS